VTDVILVVNSGSSSLKFALYPVVHDESPLVTGKVEGIGRKPVLTACMGGESLSVTNPFTNIPQDATHEWLISNLLERLYSRYTVFNLVAAGHRVVHGGSEFTKPVLIDDEVLEKLIQLIPLAPLHQSHCLKAIESIAKISPELPQVACFDTSFHHTQNRLERLFGLPREYSEEGLIRYGFHGLSYEYIAGILPKYLSKQANGRVIVAHLGNGASLCAMKDRRSIASSMGFSTLDGLIMGTRCGSLDAGVVLHLLQQNKMSLNEVEHLLYKKSGLLGVSGISNNMQVLEESSDPKAKEALELFCYRIVREIGALTAVLGGLDALVFTAGIGENSVQVRRIVCDSLSWLGISLNTDANEAGLNTISDMESNVGVHVIPTDEQAIIAKFTCKITCS